MESMVMIIFAIVFALIRIWIAQSGSDEVNSRPSDKAEKPLCNTCTCSLIRNDGSGKEFIFCNYGGRMIPVKFVVTECSGYENSRIERPSKIAGFIKPGRRLPNNVTVIRIPASKTGTD